MFPVQNPAGYCHEVILRIIFNRDRRIKRLSLGGDIMGSSILELNGHSLTLEDVAEVARERKKVALERSAVSFVERGSRMVRSWVDQGKIIYGITTGFGDLASQVIPPEKSEKLQENLLTSHACGVGEAFPEDIVRAIMLLRINSLIRGFSGISMETLSRLVDFLNIGIHPVIPCKGSVGASGDLCPLSHLAIALLGLGEVFYKGKRVQASEALRSEGLEPVTLGPKEGLALNNGTAAMTGVAALAVWEAMSLLKMADIVAAMSLVALHGVPFAFDHRTHELRPHQGQIKVAKNIRQLTKNSRIIEKHGNDRVQDAYSLRCIPQVHGASRDGVQYVKNVVQVEINSVTDNPLIFPAEGEAISGGNFHGQPVALAMDFFGIAMAEIGSISERRTARLVDGKLSGLPPFLVENSGINSGFMIPQYVSAALVSENKVLAHPSSVDSIPTSANQEDHVSMGMYSSRKGLEILNNVKKIISIELLLAAQGLDFSKPLEPGVGTRAAYEKLREEIPYIDNDRYLHPLIEKVLKRVEDSSYLRAVEGSAGALD
jgi:histidine ammonia-lyase